MTLTKIAMTKRGRVALYADGAFVMSLHPDVFAASGISVGSQIDEDALRELSDAAELREARERALSMLSRQYYTARGLRDRLTRHVSEEAAGQAVERMQELGLIDDERYAARFAQELLERRHYGAARIRQELRRRGIDSQTAAAAASLEENDPQAHILAVLEKKYPQAAGDETVRRRAWGALLRLGHSPSDVRRALDAFCGGRSGFDDD